MEIGVPNFLQHFKDLLHDPRAYVPISVYIPIFIILLVKGWRKLALYGLIIMVLYTTGASIFANHISIKILENTYSKEKERISMAVLCFYDVSQSSKNNEACHNFRYCLARCMMYIAEEYEVDVFNDNDVINEDNLKKNINLTNTKAIELGKRIGADYAIYGETSPIRDILITLRVINTELEGKVMEFEMRRRITNISSLAERASKEILYNLKEIPESEKDLVQDRLSSKRTTIRAARYFSEGLSEFFNNNYRKSIPALNSAIREDETFPDPHFLLAFIYFSQKKDRLAIRELEETIRLEPEWADPHYFLGVVLKRNGRYRDASIQYQLALKFERRLGYELIYKTALAGTFLKLGRAKEALRIVSEVEKKQEKNRKVLYNLAARYCELGKLDKALSLLSEAKKSGLSDYDCNAALSDPDFNNFKKDLPKYRQFKELLKKCE